MVRNCVIIFDLFGTLTDIESDYIVHRILSEKLAEIHGNIFKPEEHLKLYEDLIYRSSGFISSGEAVWKALEILSKEKNFSIAISKDEVLNLHRRLHIEYSRLYEDAIQVLEKAKSMCRYVVLVTDADRDIAEGIVKKHRIDKYLSLIHI